MFRFMFEVEILKEFGIHQWTFGLYNMDARNVFDYSLKNKYKWSFACAMVEVPAYLAIVQLFGVYRKLFIIILGELNEPWHYE